MRAALNNAHWCAAVWRSHGLMVHITDGLWTCDGDPPPLYPNVVTVDPDADPARQASRIGELYTARRRTAFSVKDSFGAMDLAPLGLAPLFDALWLALDPVAKARRPAAGAAPVEPVRTEGDLRAWEAAWRGADAHEPRIFLPQLLDDPDILILGQRDAHGEMIAGGIASEAAGRLGLTNLFGRARPILEALERLRPGVPVVCYEQVPEAPRGWRALGPLRVWATGG